MVELIVNQKKKNMTNQELNREISTLWNQYQYAKKERAYWDWRENYGIPKFKRLWRADPEKTRVTFQNFKRLLLLNESLGRPIPLHQLTAHIKC